MATNRALPSLGMQLGWGCYATLEGSGHQLMPCPRPSSVHAESVITAHAIHTANSRPECWADIAGAVSLSDDSGEHACAAGARGPVETEQGAGAKSQHGRCGRQHTDDPADRRADGQSQT